VPSLEQPSATFTAPDPRDLLTVATEAASAGAELALSWRRRSGQLTIEQKTGPSDLVSQADRQVEDAIRSVLSRRRPDDGVLGEEGGEVAGTSGVSWVVDPIDGTMSYLYGLPDWTVSIAAADSAGGELLAGVVAMPVLNRVVAACRGGGTTVDGHPVRVRDTTELSHALVSVNFGRADRRARAGRMVDALLPRVRHVRRGGSTAAALAEVATGSADAAWSPDAKAWDIAAGVLLVSEAGGVIGDLDGVSATGWPASCEALVACPAIWQPLRRLLAAAYSD
jgi:myo-inositol-1(or 4)-monophosphatase